MIGNNKFYIFFLKDSNKEYNKNVGGAGWKITKLLI
jgi:hypothetical protein